MANDRINWDRVNNYLTRSKTRAVLKPYGMPDITNPFTSAYADVDVAPRWPVSEEVAISVALTGGFFMTRHNPAQPITEQEIMEAGQAQGLPVSAINTTADVANDPHLAERGFFQHLDMPGGGTVGLPGFPFRMFGTPGEMRPAPALGEHTTEVLTERLGYSNQDVAVLAQRGVV